MNFNENNYEIIICMYMCCVYQYIFDNDKTYWSSIIYDIHFKVKQYFTFGFNMNGNVCDIFTL